MFTLDNIPQIYDHTIGVVEHEIRSHIEGESWDLDFVKYCHKHHPGLFKIFKIFLNLCENDNAYKVMSSCLAATLKAIDVEIAVKKLEEDENNERTRIKNCYRKNNERI